MSYQVKKADDNSNDITRFNPDHNSDDNPDNNYDDKPNVNTR
jgi:hypothetical protein